MMKTENAAKTVVVSDSRHKEKVVGFVVVNFGLFVLLLWACLSKKKMTCILTFVFGFMNACYACYVI
jgi:hypothetical protein